MKVTGVRAVAIELGGEITILGSAIVGVDS